MLRRYKKLELNELLNRAVNTTLSRTLLTSISTLIALLALFIFGGEVIRGFTAGLIWGILIGTFSSFGLAVPLLSYLKLRRSSGKEEAEEDRAAVPSAGRRVLAKGSEMDGTPLDPTGRQDRARYGNGSLHHP